MKTIIRIKCMIILFFICFNFLSCDTSTDPHNDLNDTKNLVAFTAVFNDMYESGRNFEKLIIANFYEPNNYKILTDTSIVASKPFFSKDKLKIIFGDESKFVPPPQLALYELQTNQYELLEESNLHLPMLGRQVVWNQDGTGFYYTNPPRPFSIRQDVYFCSLPEKLVSRIHDGKGFSVYPVALKHRDTLIVFSNNTEETGQPFGYYLMDTNGNYVSRINNPHLDFIWDNGVTKKSAHSLDYNKISNLFVFSEIDSTVQGYKIAVTDFTSNYYKEYTEGNFIDDHPTWGPDGKTILFDRIAIYDHSFTGYKIMHINTETGAVTEFVNPNIISGAISLRYPEF